MSKTGLSGMARQVRVRERATLKHCIREKISYDATDGHTVFAWLCRPRVGGDEPRPAVLCCHGHGPGKDPLVGLFDGQECLEYHKCVAMRLAELGFVTLAPDRRGYGEGGGAPCGYPDAAWLDRIEADGRRAQGKSRWTQDAEDARTGLDVLAGRCEVDAARLGCLGVLDGAAVAAGCGAQDSRVRAVVMACFVSDAPRPPGPPAVERQGTPPGALDLALTVCPRPLQVQSGRADGVAPWPAVRRAARQLAQTYATAGAAERFQHHEFDGVVQLDFTAAAGWLDRWLK